MSESMLKLLPGSLTTQALIVGVLVGACVYFLTKKRYKMPPCPPGWPVLGNLLDLTGNEKAFKVTDRWSKEYGPVLRLKAASIEIVMLCRIDVVLEALVKKQADFAGRPYTYSNDVIFGHGNDILTATYGPRWKLHRKLVSKAIRHYIIGGSLDKTLSKSVTISTRLMLNHEQGKPFDPNPYLALSVFNILYGMCFNKFSSSVDDEMFTHVMGVLETFTLEFGNGMLEDIIPPLRLFPTRKFRRVNKAIDDLNGLITEEVAQHRNSYQSEKTRDFVDALLLAQEEAVGEEDPFLLSQISDKHLMLTVSNVLGAGIETSRATLHWALLAMCLHPDIQKKVHQEVDAVIDADMEIRLDMRDQLPYTEAVLHETMRMRPVAPLGFPHETMRDTSVGGFELPKGTMVVINIHSLHFDPSKWENPEKFKPERFLDASGKMAPKPESWLPFSAGRRVCLGETLARPELHLILAGIMRACSVELAPGEKRDFEPQNNGAQFNSPNQYKITVKSRI